MKSWTPDIEVLAERTGMRKAGRWLAGEEAELLLANGVIATIVAVLAMVLT